MIEAKLAEDGGTAREKATRIQRLGVMCADRGMVLAAVIDGKGFRRYNDVLLPIIRNTGGRTHTLETLPEILDVADIANLAGGMP